MLGNGQALCSSQAGALSLDCSLTLIRAAGGEYDFRNFNPILHTVWLDSHALTLKNYTAKCYEVRKI
jgi:hypothetical protein